MTATEFKSETDQAVHEVYEAVLLNNDLIKDLESGLTFETYRKRAEKIATIFVVLFALCYLIIACSLVRGWS
jgi:hypothetical protein